MQDRDGKPGGDRGDGQLEEMRQGEAIGFPIVGIGASAGGLAAIEAFLTAMPVDTAVGMAFVFVQHLSPDHSSILTQLVQRYTRMEVFEVQDGMEVRSDCVYIIPPNRDIAVLHGKLQLLESDAPRGQRHTIDFFFRSLAQDLHERAICVVLSGTGTDGTLGVRAVKGEGGLVLVQRPDTSEFSGMLDSAIATGLVDYVLPPAEMPARLLAYVAHMGGIPRRLVAAASPKRLDEENAMKKVFLLLRSRTRHDFSQYKQNTIVRRIERRMAIHQIVHLDEYVRFLQQHLEEVETLFRDLLIGVTHFFRDPDAFGVLQQQAISRLFEAKVPGETVRAWVAGCATGEEAYSIAILLQEQMEARRQNYKLQVFASDIDSRALAQARTGVYPDSIGADVAPERLARYFALEADGHSYRINKTIRDILIFSEHDVIADPPFSRLDLISCRNLLIYLDGDLQRKLISMFHYALNPNGYLFLGTSETVGEHFDSFSSVDRKAKLYLRKESAYAVAGTPLRYVPAHQSDGGGAARTANKSTARGKAGLRELVERAVVAHYQPVAVLVNEQGDILYIQGRTGKYLEQPAGEVSTNILKMAREGLQRQLTTTLYRAATRKEVVQQSGLRVKTNGDYTLVDLTVRPVTADGAGTEPALFLVLLEEMPDAIVSDMGALSPSGTTSDADAHGGEGGEGGKGGTERNGISELEARIAALVQELRARDEYVQTIQDELETSNEELRSSNEEMQSVNEELQSTNEELETSKEELQSVNEELSTVNVELLNKVADLSRANNDMNNLLAGTGIGTVFVDHELCIQRFTPAVTQVINLISSDVGRPIGHIVSNLRGYDRLLADVQGVLDTLVPRAVEVQTEAGTWFLLRIRPYRTLENVIEGAVVTFTDISEMKRAQAALQETQSLRRLAVVVRDSFDAITMQDLNGHILAWNPGATRLFGWTEEEALTKNIADLMPPGTTRVATEIVERVLRGEFVAPVRIQRITKDGRTIEVILTATALLNDVGQTYALATTERATG